MVAGVPGDFTGGVLQLENSPFRKLNSLSLLPDNLASAEHARQPKMCSISGQRIEFLGGAISSALELCARVLVRFTLISARAWACDSFRIGGERGEGAGHQRDRTFGVYRPVGDDERTCARIKEGLC
jgi:hypothetical protein